MISTTISHPARAALVTGCRVAQWHHCATSGKGQFTDLSTGHAGQLLRLLSVDALLRKLRFDFSDTFSEGFYLIRFNSTAWIKDGVPYTDDTLVDGLKRILP